MPLPRGKVALNVAISIEARKILRIVAAQKGATMAELIEELIRMKYDKQFSQQQNNGTI